MSPAGSLTVFFEGGAYLECPRWHDGRWWGSDFYRYGVFTYDGDGREEQVVEIAGQPSGRGWLPDGDMLVVSMKDRRVRRRATDGSLTVHADVSDRFTAFTIQPDGTLADRRVWAQIDPTPDPADIETMLGAVSFAPDGCALDAEGHVWVANALGGPLSRIAAGGQIVDEVSIPEGLGAFACGLGGEDGRTLMVCAALDFHEEARKAAREGVLLMTTVDVPHAGLP